MKQFTKSAWFVLIFLFLFLAITYLPDINHFGYYNDDWWQIYGGETFGTQRFAEMYSSDRPARAFLHAPLFAIFGSQILPYQIVSLVLRWLGAIGLFWTLSLIWKNQRKEILLMSLLFLIYPGFLEQPNGFDYLSHQLAISSMIFSIGFSVKYINEDSISFKAIYFFFSTLFALTTFFLMDYYIGMESYRWLIIGYLLFKKNSGKIKVTIVDILKKVPGLSLPMVIFLVWRVFFFSGSRYTTDLGRIGSGILANPILGLFNIFRRWFVDVGDIFFSIWTEPSYQTLSDLRGYDLIYAIIFGLIATALIIIYLRINGSKDISTENDHNWAMDAAIIGFLGAILCLLPINIAERDVSFPIFNRFSFPSSIGVSISTIAILSFILNQKWQTFLYCLLIFTSVITNYTNNDFFANRWGETQKLWQQWIIRIPSLEKGTVLLGKSAFPIQEAYTTWAPANLLYFYDVTDILVGSEVLNVNTIQEIKMNNSVSRNSRTFEFVFEYTDSLIFSKPTKDTCLRFLDQNQIELSIDDDPLIALAAPYSHIDKIKSGSTLNQAMFTKLFGQEVNDDTWCYIYEKASLARQFGDWQAIIDLHATARENDLRPYDPIEWFPFLQAYAYTGNFEEVDQLVPIINETPYYSYQACQIFSNKPKVSDSEIQAGNLYLTETFCK